VEFVILIGRIMFGALFVASGLGHLSQSASMGRYAESRGVPRGRLATQVSGVAIILGAASVILGIVPDLGALVLVAFLLGTALLIHKFWTEPEGDVRMMAQTQFMKDIALAGAALVMFGFFAEAGDALRFTMTGSAF